MQQAHLPAEVGPVRIWPIEEAAPGTVTAAGAVSNLTSAAAGSLGGAASTDRSLREAEAGGLRVQAVGVR